MTTNPALPRSRRFTCYCGAVVMGLPVCRECAAELVAAFLTGSLEPGLRDVDNVA